MKRTPLAACAVLALLLATAPAMAESDLVLVEVNSINWQGQSAY